MTTINDILSLSNGARFYRADLHVHSFGASHDVTDAKMTPKEIVKTAIAEGLHLISITDHNEINNVEPALKAAGGTSLLVVPGVELSTPQGHLLCYLPTLTVLQKFFGRLEIADHGLQTSHCQNAMLDCLNLLGELGGYGVLAHVDADGGFEKIVASGNTPHKLNVLCHPCLMGIELKSASSDISYSDSDPNKDRVAAGTERIKRLGLGSRQWLARLLNSDAHTLKALGRNAAGDKKVSRVKMDSPSFDALRIALGDSDARVRIEEQIPSSVPRLLGLNAEGGFLDGMQIHFSPNLNCIIGGRGTGKSTTFEAVRCLIANVAAGDVVDSEIWPDHLRLFWQDQAGEQHELYRPNQGVVTHVVDPEAGPTSFQIESYGQGETARISKEAHENPVALLSYLNRFVDIAQLQVEEDQARDELLALQTEIEKARKNVARIPDTERDLKTKQQQLSALEKAKAKEVIALQRKLEQERAVRSQITVKLSEMAKQLNELDPSASVEEIASLVEPGTLVVGATEFNEIVAKARSFQAVVKDAKDKTSVGFNAFRKATDAQLVAWKAKEAEAQKTIETKKKELESQNVRLDMIYIAQLAKDEARLTTEIRNLKTWVPHLKELERKSAIESKRRWSARSRIAAARAGYARLASDTLKSVLADLVVSLKFLPSSHSPGAEEQIIAAMEWRTSQVPRAALLVEQLTLPGLLTAIDKKDTAPILSVQTPEKPRVFNAAEASRLIERLSEPTVRFALERSEVHDLPKLTITGSIARTGAKPQYVTRDFTKLSLGQQQSVLLALMLSSNSNSPLIIDQPEDNLDSEFIYKTLVPVLRLAKERRQVIIVTHNANIAVLGDAEQIIVLKSTNEKSSIVSRGSIDDPATRDVACGILEGAKEAFQRRAKIYGVVN